MVQYLYILNVVLMGVRSIGMSGSLDNLIIGNWNLLLLCRITVFQNAKE